MAQRKALASLEINRSYGKELSPYQRGQISAYKAMGLTNQKISQNLQCDKTTIFNTLIRNPLHNQDKSLPRSGRPQALNKVQKRNILRFIRINSKVTYQEIKFEIDISIY